MRKSNKINEKEKKEQSCLLKNAMENKETLGILVERVDNILDVMEKNHQENKEEHSGIIARQDHTNGNVSDLQKKTEYNRGRLNMFAVLTTLIILPFFIFVLRDYFEKREEILIQKQQYEQILKRVDINNTEIDKRISNAILENNKKQFETFNP